MTGKTHLLAGANLAGWGLFAFSAQPFSPLWPVLGALGGLLPDLDANESELQNYSIRLGRRGPRLRLLKPVAFIAHTLFGHRGLLHSLLALVIIVGGMSLFSVPSTLTLAVGLGYASHLLLDGLTPSGVPLFWPAPGRVRLSPWIRLTTGGWLDQLLFVALSLSIVALVATVAPDLSLDQPYA